LTESFSKKKTGENLFFPGLTLLTFLTSGFYALSIIGKGRLIEKIFYPLCNNPAKMVSIFKTSVIRTSIVLAVIWILFALFKLKKIKPTFITASLIAVLFAELFNYNLPLNKPRTIAKLEDGFNGLQVMRTDQQYEKFRVWGIQYIYQIGLYKYGIERFDGYEPLIEKHLFMIYMGIKKQIGLDYPQYMKFLLYATELANTKYFIFQRKVGKDVEDWFRSGIIKIKGNKYQLFQTNNYNPRAFFADTLQRGKDIGDFYSFVMRKDYKRAVYTESESAQGSNRI
jgi:hypothetical protein